MKFILPFLLILSFSVFGQNSSFNSQFSANWISRHADIFNDSVKFTKAPKGQMPMANELITLAFSEVGKSKQLELSDSLSITKSKYRQSKYRKKLLHYNDLPQLQKENANHIIPNPTTVDIYNNIEETPLNLQIHGFASVSGISDNIVPFWMRSMQYGSIPLNGLSTSIIGGVQKTYDQLRVHKLFDWGFDAEARLNAGSTTQFILIEAYAKARLSIFQLKVGRSKEITGLVDSTLSSGAFSVSGNALGIPKIELGIPEYWSLPYTNHLIALKGTFDNGLMGEKNLNSNTPGFRNLLDHVGTYYNQISLYGRLGKPGWKVKLYGGLNHQVMWGNEDKIFKNFGLSNFQDFFYAVTAKSYYSVENNILKSRVGDSRGSIDQGLEISLKNSLISGYHQFFYDAGALAYLANIKDGLWGINIKNKANRDFHFSWKKFLIEFLYSKSQGGEPNSKPHGASAEDYYNHGLYMQGWTYLDENIGNPFFTSKKYIRNGLPQTYWEYFPNTRIMAFHTGAEFTFAQWNCKTLLSWSANYGTWFTAPATRLYESEIQYNPPPYFPKVDQFSGYLEANRSLKNGYSIGFALAADKGELLNNSVGGFVKITKTW